MGAAVSRSRMQSAANEGATNAIYTDLLALTLRTVCPTPITHPLSYVLPYRLYRNHPREEVGRYRHVSSAYFLTYYTEITLVRKLAVTAATSSRYFLTYYTEITVVRKLAVTTTTADASPYAIQKSLSWGSWPLLQPPAAGTS